jgi:hypothetical protein
MRQVCLLATLLSAMTLASAQSAHALPFANDAASSKSAVRNSAFTVSLHPDGRYSVIAPGGWTLNGSLPGFSVSPPSGGTDRIGPYRELHAMNSDGRSASMRIYQGKPLVLFIDSWTKAGSNSDAFPTFVALPADATRYSFQRDSFSPYEFNKLGEEGPWVLFNNSHALVLSPADHFKISTMNVAADGPAASAINAKIASLPDGFSHATLLAAGDGVDDAMKNWGAALQTLGGKKPTANDADAVLAKFGYWTDNGAAYYYKFEPKLGYAGTLLAVKDSFAKMGIPLGYMQLDSWFYTKGKRASWDDGGGDLPFGEDVYRADPKLFPDGLAAFHQQLGLPLVTHARWVSSTSPYRHEYKMSGNVVIDPKFWNETAAYLKNAGVITYEQDWLDRNASTDMNVSDPSKFLNEMASSMQQQGLSMQYCMAPPSDYMASSQYQNLATIRTSDDRFEREHWDAFLYDSRMATALGAQPWVDVFMSPETGNLLIATLSGGPVGVGDALGKTSVENVRNVMRADSVIVKPDVGLHPIERMYAEDAAGKQSPMIAVASSGAGDSAAHYVFAYPRKASDTNTTVALSELNISGGAIAYDWVKKTAVAVAPGGNVTIDFDGESDDGGVDKAAPTDRWGYAVVTPLSKSGIAIIGDANQFATLGSKRISSVMGTGEGEQVTVHFAAGEGPRTVVGYAKHAPRVESGRSTAHLAEYNPDTKLFRIEVTPGNTQTATFSVR